jgi:hypothetical protein
VDNYKDAAYKVLSFRGKNAAVGMFCAARAFDNVKPGQLVVTGGGAAMWTSPTKDFSADYQGFTVIPVPPAGYPSGLSFQSPFNWWNDGYDGTINDKAITPLLTDWGYSDLPKIIGPENFSFVDAMKRLYDKRIVGKGILTKDEEFLVGNALVFGMIPSIKPRKRQNDEAWNALSDEWSALFRFYTAKAISQGKEAIAASEAAVERWETIYKLTKAVAELPSTIVSTAVKGTGFIGWQMLKSNPLLVIGAVGILFIMFAPKIAAAVGMAKGAAGRAKDAVKAIKGG